MKIINSRPIKKHNLNVVSRRHICECGYRATSYEIGKESFDNLLNDIKLVEEIKSSLSEVGKMMRSLC